MKNLSKLFYLLVMTLLTVALVACGATTEQPGAEVPGAEVPQETTPEEPAAEEPAAEEPVAEEPAAEGDAVTIRYANWNLGTEEENNLQRQMVQAFMDANPNVTVEFVDMSAEGGWEAVLTTYAARGELPDVFMANNVPLYIQNDWIADLTEMVEADPDWANVPDVLKDTVTYNGQVHGLPAAQFVMGYFVNKDLYEASNLDAPEYGFSVEEFEEAVTEMHDPAQGVLGLDEFEFTMGWYANTQDPNLKWFSYDGEQLHYNSPAFKEAVTFAGEMQPYTWQGLTEEQIGNFRATGPWELFLNQEVGMRWDGAWAVPDYVKNAEFEWDFVGIPGGNQAMVSDVIVVSNTAANPQVAYEFAKWMTFSKEAYAVEAEIARGLESAPKMPVSLDEESLALYQEFVDVPGIQTALNNLDNSMVESLAKVVPGYINARWEGKPGIAIGDEADVNVAYIFANAHTGQYKYEDYSAQLEEFANQILADAEAQMSQ
jgi:multiple sugar transport system substrate-binding protein